MASLRKLADDVSALFVAHARRVFRTSMFVKVILLLGGALIAGGAEAFEIADGNVSALTVAALAGFGLVFLGGVYVAITDSDVSRALDTARQALEEVRLRERQMDRFNADRARLAKEVGRGLELYNSIDVMRGAIEQSLALPAVPATTIIQTCLSAASNSLLVAFDFDIQDTWTIAVYMAEEPQESDKSILRCIAHIRKIACEIANARAWAAGVGVAGIAYSMGNEVIIPNMSAPELGTVFNLGTLARSYDDERYQSMAAIPIRVGASQVPWGVAVVTSDQQGHFSPEASDGVSTSEPIRAIAAMAALAVMATKVRDHSTAPVERNSPAVALSTENGSRHGADIVKN
jgi:hypothetical protein